jgi:flagellar L-ring protein precursor FlgH
MKPNRKLARQITFLSACLGSTIALGQAAPQGGANPGPRAGTQPDKSQPQRPANNSAAQQAGVIMQRNGSSLLKAQLSLAADPQQAKLSQVSFFAVPEQEPKTLKKHDLITIVIREESQFDSKAETDFNKNAQLQAQANQLFQLRLSNFSIKSLTPPTPVPGIDLTGNRTFKGAGEVDRTDTFTARITAEILDVKPNGTLVLQARKRIKTDEEEQQFILTGTCRVDDVAADNTILSTQLYDLELQKNHKGNVRKATERGNLPKLLDFINPF